MKKHLFLLLLLLATYSKAKSSIIDSIQYINNKASIEEIVLSSGYTRTQLYGKAKILLTKDYNLSKLEIQSEDPLNNIIIVKSELVKSADNGFGGIYYPFTLIIQTKDDKFKYTITDISLDMTGLAPMKVSFEELIVGAKNAGKYDGIEEIYNEFKPFIKFIKEYMVPTSKDNW